MKTHLADVSYDVRIRLDTFIHDVFNYYNGKINKFNYPAKLIVEWTTNESREILGSSKLPNIVMIYPQVLIDYLFDTYPYEKITELGVISDMKCWIIDTIIHELYHIDQCIDYTTYVSNHQYQMRIESAVEVATAIYILNNKMEIYNKFGVRVFDDSSYREIISNQDKCFYPYYRLDIINHLYFIISPMIVDNYGDFTLFGFSNNEITFLYDILKDPKYDISISINGVSFNIRINGIFANMFDINEYFYNTYYFANYHIGTNVFLHFEDNKFNIKIETVNSNSMLYHRKE